MYGITNSVKLFSGELNNWLIYDTVFKQSQFQISIYYKYAPGGSNLVVLSYFDDCLYWYTYEELVKCFMDSFGKIFHVKLLGYSHSCI